MAIVVQGNAGKELAKLQEEVVRARRRVRDAERAFETAAREVTELDGRLTRLEGQEMAGHDVRKEIKSVTRALTDARERSSDKAKRDLVVLRSAQTAHEERVAAFICDNASELEAPLHKEAQEVVRRTEEHVRSALASRESYMAVYQSFAELLRLTTGNTGALPSSDGAISYFRDLERFAENRLQVPVPREHARAA